MKVKRLSADDLLRLLSKTRIKEPSRDILRRVFVDGVSAANVAIEYKITPQRVRRLVSTIEKVFSEQLSSSAGLSLVRIEVDLPERIALAVEELAREFGRNPQLSEEAKSHASAMAVEALRSTAEGMRRTSSSAI